MSGFRRTGWRTAVAAFALALAAAPAAAGWEAAEWDMTPRQVAAAMAGRAPLGRGSGSDRLGGKKVGNVGIHTIGKARFRAVYHFDARGLSLVHLELQRGRCDDLYRELVARHGPPLRVSDQLVLRLFIWHDRPQRTRVRLLVSASLCNLNYERLSDYEAHDLAPPR